MRILVLATAPRQPDNHLLWEGLQKFAQVEIHFFSKQEQKNLGAILKRFDFAAYDRVVCDLLFRYLVRQQKILSRINGLLIYEEDACQEFIDNSKWKGVFSRFYKRLPNARVVLTGFQVCQRFKLMGVDAHFLPKGYDDSKLYNMELERDIPLGFVGRVNSDTYAQRKDFLRLVERDFGLRLLRSEPGDDYRNLLNRIKVFVSADIGLGEYMAKNFEAMACGCAVIAFSQGGGEEIALGLTAEHNIALYQDYESFKLTLQRLLDDEVLLKNIALAGSGHAREFFSYSGQAGLVYKFLEGHDTRVLRSSLWLSIYGFLRK